LQTSVWHGWLQYRIAPKIDRNSNNLFQGIPVSFRLSPLNGSNHFQNAS
jgi:hypothetical protein